jgi:DNA-binding winged helix-turn-helix (wHTH) protein/Tfp pilus assembly protein PilF
MALNPSESPQNGRMAAGYEFKGYRLDAIRRQLRDPQSRLVDVPTRAFDTLLYLIEQRSQIVDKNRLMQAVWPGVVVEENNLSQAISALRRVLGEERADPQFVVTVPGRGYRFVAPVTELAASLDAAPTARTSTTPLDSLAVLPFKPLLPGKSDPALELGMADTLIAEISSLPNLRVSPLGTVRRFVAIDQDPIDAGSELGVAGVLEGSIQIQEQRLRVTARLLRVSDGQSLWSGKFDEPVSDVFAIQDSIAARVIAALRPALGARPSEHSSLRQTRSLSAYQFYVAGLYHQLRRDLDGRPEAVRNFEAAIQADPNYVRAWAGLSVALAVQGVFGTQPPASVFPRAHAAALRAVALDANSADALGALGHVLVQYHHQYAEGHRHYLRARELDGNNAQLRLWIAINEAHLGRFDRALEEVRLAIEIEPRTLAFSACLGMLLYYARSFDQAIAHLQHLLEIEPQFDQVRTFLGKAWLLHGDPDRALTHFHARTSGTPGGFGDLGCAHARAGQLVEARAEIDRLRGLKAAGYGVEYDLATICAQLGEHAEACRCLERALEDHSQVIGFLRCDPMLDPLRSEAGYARVFRQLYGSEP